MGVEIHLPLGEFFATVDNVNLKFFRGELENAAAGYGWKTALWYCERLILLNYT